MLRLRFSFRPPSRFCLLINESFGCYWATPSQTNNFEAVQSHISQSKANKLIKLNESITARARTSACSIVFTTCLWCPTKFNVFIIHCELSEKVRHGWHQHQSVDKKMRLINVHTSPAWRERRQQKIITRRQFGVTRIAVVFRQLTILLNVIDDCGAKSCVDYAESSGFLFAPFYAGGNRGNVTWRYFGWLKVY